MGDLEHVVAIMEKLEAHQEVMKACQETMEAIKFMVESNMGTTMSTSQERIETVLNQYLNYDSDILASRIFTALGSSYKIVSFHVDFFHAFL
jgi:hypothetical protein